MEYSYITTLFIYTVVFSLSVFFAYLNGVTNKNFWALLAIILPATLAGGRGALIGQDFENYLNIANNLSTCGFQLPWEEGWPPLEYGFNLLLWCFAHLFSNKAIVFSCVYGVLLSLAYFGCLNLDAVYRRQCLSDAHKIRTQAWIGYCVFLFACFIPTFNLLRQGLSIACILYCIPFLLNRNYSKALLVFLLALSFHTSAVFVLPWILFLGSRDTEKIRTIAAIVFYGLLLVSFPFFANLFGYANYLDSDVNVGGVNGSILLLPLVAFSFWLPRNPFFLWILKGGILALYMWGISFFISYGYVSRLYYFMEIFVITFAIVSRYQQDVNRRSLMLLWVLFFVLGYRYVYVFLHSGQQLYFEWIK